MNDSVRITDPRRPSGTATARAYLELTKPRIIELLLTTTLPAMILAAGGWPGWWLAIATLIGGTLSAGGANVINQVLDAGRMDTAPPEDEAEEPGSRTEELGDTTELSRQ